MKTKSPSIRLHYLALAAPAIAVFSVGMLVPVAIGFRYSLTDWNGLARNLHFVGLANYGRALQDTFFHNSFLFTLMFALLNTVINNTCAFSLALLFDRNLKLRNLARAVVFAPVLLSPLLCGFIWSRIYSEVLPGLAKLLGITADFNLFGRPRTVALGIAIANNWQWIGYWMLIYLAGLQTIPKELHEAMTIDGGSGWHRLTRITLPLMVPSFTVCVVGTSTGSLKVFEIILASTGGGPGKASESVVLYIYNQAFALQRPSYASALAMLFFLLLVLLAAVQLRVMRSREVQL